MGRVGRAILFFFSSRRRHTIWNCDWSSDVCSSDLEVQFLDVPQAIKARTVEGLLAKAVHTERPPSEIGGSTTDIAKNAYALKAQAPRFKGLAEGEEGVVAMAIGQADVSVIAGEQSCGVTRVIVFRMAGEFRAKLVVPKPKSERGSEHGRNLGGRLEVVIPI